MALPTYSHKTMTLNILLFYSTLTLGGYLLANKSLILFILYTATLTITLIVGRYFVCTPCHYYGKPCPSFGFSYLALIFPKAENKPFSGRAALIETTIIGACLILPVLSWIFSWIGLIKPYSMPEHFLMAIYIVLLISMSLVHKRTGCDKCEIKDCPLSKD